MTEKKDEAKSISQSRHYNRPGLVDLIYRRGSHGEILKRLTDRLAVEEIPDGNLKGIRPLSDLTVRTSDDPLLALLDAWAVSLDVLGLYQERIANEGYLRAADERKSVQELVRSLGYELKPGVAASAKLSFFVEDAPGAPDEVNIPKGTKVVSIPGQDEMPQTFETTADSLAKASWNQMTPQLKAPQKISSKAEKLYLQGIDTHLHPGEKVLFTTQNRIDSPDSKWWDVGNISLVELIQLENQTCLVWDSFIKKTDFSKLSGDEVRIFAFRETAALFGKNAPLWSQLSLQEQQEYVDVDFNINSIAVSPDTKRLIAGVTDHRLHVFDLASGNWSGSLKRLPGKINSVTWSSNGKWFASGSDDGIVRLWDANENRELAKFSSHSGPVTTLAFSGDDKYLCSGGEDKTICLWDVEKGESEPLMQSPTGLGSVISILFIDADEVIVCGYSNGDIILRNMKDGLEKHALSGHSDAITGLSLSADFKHLLSSSLDGTIRLWEPAGSQLDQFDVLESYATSVAFLPAAKSPSAKYPKFVTGCADGSVRKWEIFSDGGSTWPEIEGLTYQVAEVSSLAFSQGDLLFSAAGNEIKALEFPSGELKQTFSIPLPKEFPKEWPGFLFQDNYIDLDAIYSKVVPDGWILLENQHQTKVFRIVKTQKVQRDDFLISGQVTRLELDTGEKLEEFNPRETIVRLQSEELNPAECPLKRLDPIKGNRIELDCLVTGLSSGKGLIVNGKRSRIQIKKYKTAQMSSDDLSRTIELEAGDILTITKMPGVNRDGKKAYFLENQTGFSGHVVTEDFDPLPWDVILADEDDDVISQLVELKNVIQGQKTSTLDLEDSLDYYFDPTTVSVNGNVVEATHGETFQETLGSGDGTLINQAFTLKKTPLTFIPVPTAKGSESTLEIRVNDVLWREVPSLFDAGPLDRVFVTRIEDDDSTIVTFGDNVNGESLPSGLENIKATYRTGGGAEGEVAANTLRLLQTRPLGIREVDNPLPASGATDPESRDKARENAPLSVLTLERIVSLMDYQNFASSYAGISKAIGAEFIREENLFVHLTVSAEDGKPLIENSSLHQNLAAAIDSARIPYHEVQISSYEQILFNIVAKVLIDADFMASIVLEQAEKALRDHFVFVKRRFGQEVTSAEIITCLQSIPGINAVDFDQLYRNDSVLLELDIKYQEELDSKKNLDNDNADCLWVMVNKGLVEDWDETESTAKVSKQAAIFKDKKGIRWRIVDTALTLSVVKQRGKLELYSFTEQAITLLQAEKARMIGDQIEPAQLLLLNPDPAGTILMEF